ncbi:hypothetical protein J1605_004034 [Eschrichtius robustus]|uniref:Uncharacterized protein n=1 Tax=Eschrichtius robustus TaxID=9764 RepID=A0AB34HMR7_ESCRO|nr:hypothetical protein J1605_004034 [Eschrichtius robustus]
MRAPLGRLGEGEEREEGVRLRLLVGRSRVTWQGRRRRYRARGEGGREEGRSEGRKAGKGGRKRTRGREVPVLEVLGALPAPEVGREGGASPFLLPGEVPAPRGGSGPSLFSFSLRIDVLLLTREEAAVAAEDGVSESVNSAPLLGGGTRSSCLVANSGVRSVAENRRAGSWEVAIVLFFTGRSDPDRPGSAEGPPVEG